MLEGIVIEPVGEESQAASRHRNCAISRIDKDGAEEVEVETHADDDQSPLPVKAMCRGDSERPLARTKAARGAEGERSPMRAEAARGVDVKRPSPRAEAARGVDVER